MKQRSPFTNFLVSSAVSDEVLDSLMRDSFFVPQDIMEHAVRRGWTIYEIKIMPNEEFWNSDAQVLLREFATNVKYDPSETVVREAKHIGVAARTHTNGRIYVIAKHWFV